MNRLMAEPPWTAKTFSSITIGRSLRRTSTFSAYSLFIVSQFYGDDYLIFAVKAPGCRDIPDSFP